MRCVRDQNDNHVIQKCIECVPEEFIQFIVTTFFDQVVTLSTHPYGCQVIQHCTDPKTQNKVMDEILGSVSMLAQDQYGNYVVQMSQQKFASNAVEKCLTFGGPAERLLLKVLETCEEQQRERILSRIKVHLNTLKKYTYGKHIVARVEKLVAAGERRMAVQTQLAA
ncbi:hypothetical protein F3Y22_tig00001644pilonHSYRG00363 [Hibiscus syriacus]|uniref:PUM-HD domain-containing protein n=1 Tax=Hibiscus syriacus TaxID=106335 RepID=A0A6A3CZY7_HIBSY|nr:hypothetical protein F3Y22_tig00001644pilonHSYRG00363 [Hibiscus syriacus]